MRSSAVPQSGTLARNGTAADIITKSVYLKYMLTLMSPFPFQGFDGMQFLYGMTILLIFSIFHEPVVVPTFPEKAVFIISKHCLEIDLLQMIWPDFEQCPTAGAQQKLILLNNPSAFKVKVTVPV